MSTVHEAFAKGKPQKNSYYYTRRYNWITWNPPKSRTIVYYSITHNYTYRYMYVYTYIYLYLYSYTCTNIQQEHIYKSFPFLAPFQRAQTTALHHSQPSKRQKNAHRNTKSIHFQTDFFARSPSLHPIGSTCIAIIAAMTHTMHLLVDHHLVRHIAKGHDHSHTNGVKNNCDLFLGGTCLVRL